MPGRTQPPRSFNGPIETLESRRLMATVGPVVAQEFVGTVDSITSVVLTFDVPLDPVSANNPAGYHLIKKFGSSDDGGGFFGGGIIGGGDDDQGNESKRITIDTATYDATANTVTLVTKNPFKLRKSFTVINVEGKGDNAVKTADGQAIDGDGNGKAGGDLNLRFKAAVRKTMSYREADGDRVKVRVDGPGRIFYFIAKRSRSSPSIFTRETDTTTLITATVKKGKHGDGVVDLAQIAGTSTASFAFLNDPALRIRSTSPAS